MLLIWSKAQNVIRQQQERLFREWITEHRGILVKVASAFSNPADRDDLMQELLLAVWHSIPAFRGGSKPGTFLYRVAYNCALTWKRKEVAQSRHQREVEQDLRHSRTTEPDSDVESDIANLYAAIRQLPAADRALILLSLDQHSYAEMSDILGITENNIGVRLTRIRKRLAELLTTQLEGKET